MEPFRPAVDLIALKLDPQTGLGPDQKRALAAILQTDMTSDDGLSPVSNCLARLTRSLVRSLADRKPSLQLARLRDPDRLL